MGHDMFRWLRNKIAKRSRVVSAAQTLIRENGPSARQMAYEKLLGDNPSDEEIRFAGKVRVEVERQLKP